MGYQTILYAEDGPVGTPWLLLTTPATALSEHTDINRQRQS